MNDLKTKIADKRKSIIDRYLNGDIRKISKEQVIEDFNFICIPFCGQSCIPERIYTEGIVTKTNIEKLKKEIDEIEICKLPSLSFYIHDLHKKWQLSSDDARYFQGYVFFSFLKRDAK